MSRGSVETYVQSTTPCPSCAEKDAEIERLQNIIIGQINSLRRHAATVGDRYSDEAMALQHLLRGEG